MNWKRWFLIGVLVLGLLAVGTLSAVWAQEYRFTVDRNVSHVIVNQDGSADMEYWLTFTCDPGAHPIDIVDVGLPNKSYRLGSAQAAFISPEGVESPVFDIRKSEWLDVGVEIHLDEHTIWPGEQGTVYLKINVGEMVYPDSSDETYASLRFTPHYYDAANVHGTTDLEIHFYFPPGVTSEKTRYHEREPDEFDLIDDRIVFIYRYPDASPSRAYPQGISFPRSAVEVVNKAPVATRVTRSVGGASTARPSGLVSECIGPGTILLLIIALVGASVRWNGRRKIEYEPPVLSVEGMGIKRGLTAVEAAILLERPMDKILTMIMFGLLKKRALRVLSDDPLRLEVVWPQPEDKPRGYEMSFLASIKADGSLNEEHLQGILVWLVKDVNAKMKGFSRKETVAYYQGIVSRAWGQVEAATTPEIKSRQFDEDLEWMMMDADFKEQSTRTLGEGPVLMPSWWTFYQPWEPVVQSARSTALQPAQDTGRAVAGHGSQVEEQATRPAERSPQREKPATLPTLPGAAFASMVVGGIEHSADGVVSQLERFTAGVGDRLKALAGGMAQRTPQPTSTDFDEKPPSFVSSSDESTFSCACACACAGCACACAGGGR